MHRGSKREVNEHSQWQFHCQKRWKEETQVDCIAANYSVLAHMASPYISFPTCLLIWALNNNCSSSIYVISLKANIYIDPARYFWVGIYGHEVPKLNNWFDCLVSGHMHAFNNNKYVYVLFLIFVSLELVLGDCDLVSLGCITIWVCGRSNIWVLRPG
jgi:hypothetical protein